MRIAAVLLLAAGASFAQQQPLGFKDLLLGMPLADAGVSKKLQCRGEKCFYFIDSHLRDPETIAGTAIHGITVAREGGAIQSILISFKASAFDQVKDAMVEKYPDLKCDRSEVQNRMGATFDQVDCKLTTADKSNLLLVKRGSRVDDGYAYFETKAAFDAAVKRRAETKKDL